MRNATETTTPTTLPPCPEWCDLDEGHEYDKTYKPDDPIQRLHQVMFDNDVTWIWIASEEHRLPDGTVELSRPALEVSDVNDLDGVQLTAAEARSLGTAILLAADRLDEINGGGA